MELIITAGMLAVLAVTYGIYSAKKRIQRHVNNSCVYERERFNL